MQLITALARDLRRLWQSNKTKPNSGSGYCFHIQKSNPLTISDVLVAQLDFGAPQSWVLGPFNPFRSMYVSDDTLFRGLPTNTHWHAKKKKKIPKHGSAKS